MLIGEKVASRYEIISQIGAGGMGIVYKAKDIIDDRIVAVKVLKESIQSDKHHKRFYREFRALANMEHPNIVKVLDYGDYKDNNYFAMDFIEGDSLKDVRKNYPNGIIDEKTLVNYTLQTCYALSHIHSKKIIHRDVKPSNLMVTNDEKVILMDFGLVKSKDFSGSLTLDGEIVGTIYYMSPEQTQGMNINYNTDLYSLGVVLYQCVTGKLPFVGNAIISIIYKQIHEIPEKPRHYNNNISREFEEVIIRLLEKDQARRYQFADEVIFELQALEGLSTMLSIEYKSEADSTRKLILVSPTVGREKEKIRIHQMVDKLKRGESNFLFINGEVGIGKTRMVDEAVAYCRINGMKILKAFYSEDEKKPYFAFIKFIKAIFDEEGYYIAQNLSKFYLQVLVSLIPELAERNSVKGQNLDMAELESGKIKKDTYPEAIFETIRLYSRNKPIFLVTEDIHWIDKTSWEMMEYFHERKSEIPFIFLSTYRRQEMRLRTQICESVKKLEKTNVLIELHPLEKELISKMIRYILGQDEISEGVVELIARKSGGNPLFVEELLRGYVEESVIYREDGTWKKIRETEELSIPLHISRIILRRFANMEKEQKILLSRAAVIGQRFSYDVLSYLTGFEVLQLFELIDISIDMDIIIELEAQEDLYEFSQHYFRQVLYNDIDPEERKNLHLQIAQFLEKEMDKDESQKNYYNQISYHYNRSGNSDKAIKYLVLSADREKDIFAYPEAMRDFEKIIDIIDGLGEKGEEYIQTKIDALICIAPLLQFWGENDGAKSKFNEALALSTDHDYKMGLALAHQRMGVLYRNQGFVDEAMEHYEKGKAIAQEIGNFDLEADCLNGVAAVYFFKSKFEEALKINLELLEVYKKAGNEKQIATCMNNIGAIYLRTGKYDKTLEYFEKAAETFQKLGEKKNAGMAVTNCGAILHALGKPERALEKYEEALKIYREIGFRQGIADVLVSMGAVYLDRSDLEKALGKYNEALRIFEAIEVLPRITLCLNGIAEIHKKLGEYEKALEYQEKALASAEGIGDKREIAAAYLCLGDIYLSFYSLHLAKENYEKALSFARETKFVDVIISVLSELGVVSYLLKKYEKAEECFKKALEQIGDDKDYELFVKLWLCAMYLHKSDLAKAKEIYEEIEPLFDETVNKVYANSKFLYKGRIEEDEKEIRQAIEKFSSMQKNEQLWKSYYYLGKIYEKKGREDRAIRAFYKAYHILNERILPNIPIEYRSDFLSFEMIMDLEEKLGKILG